MSALDDFLNTWGKTLIGSLLGEAASIELADLRAELAGAKNGKLHADEEMKHIREDLESETRWANHYAARAQEFRDAIGPLLAYRDANTLNFQLEKLDDHLGKLRELMEKQP